MLVLCTCTEVATFQVASRCLIQLAQAHAQVLPQCTRIVGAGMKCRCMWTNVAIAIFTMFQQGVGAEIGSGVTRSQLLVRPQGTRSAYLVAPQTGVYMAVILMLLTVRTRSGRPVKEPRRNRHGLKTATGSKSVATSRTAGAKVMATMLLQTTDLAAGTLNMRCLLPVCETQQQGSLRQIR